MNKNELELEKAKIGAGKFQQVVDVIRLIVMAVAGLWAIKLIFDGLEPLIKGNSPEAITALTKLVDALHLGSVLGYIWGAAASGAWIYERRGKQRAIKKKNRYQAAAEDGEPNRTSSGLTEVGGTPRTE